MTAASRLTGALLLRGGLDSILAGLDSGRLGIAAVAEGTSNTLEKKDSRLVHVGSGAGNRDLAERLLAHYGKRAEGSLPRKFLLFPPDEPDTPAATPIESQ